MEPINNAVEADGMRLFACLGRTISKLLLSDFDLYSESGKDIGQQEVKIKKKTKNYSGTELEQILVVLMKSHTWLLYQHFLFTKC